MKYACVLAIGGLDPSGGAGILADATAIRLGGAFACAVATVLTVQSTRGLVRAEPVAPRVWLAQARCVLADQNVRAIKIGALGNAENVRAAAKLVAAHRLPVVVDPVMLPSRGRARLLDPRALDALRRNLLPRATLVTPNVAEAEALTGLHVRNMSEAYGAASELVEMGAFAALVKGGHLPGKDVVDVLAVRGLDDGVGVTGPRRRLRRPIHGTGCTFASLVAAKLALGEDVVEAVRDAKRMHSKWLELAVDVGEGALVLAV